MSKDEILILLIILNVVKIGIKLKILTDVSRNMLYFAQIAY